MSRHPVEDYFKSHRRVLTIVFTVVCMIAASGYFMGLHQIHQDTKAREQNYWEDNYTLDANQDASLPLAPQYSEQGTTDWKSNSEWRAHFAKLRTESLERSPTSKLRPKELEAALLLRDQRRSYDTAPPVVPHSIDEQNPRTCVTCHAPGNARLIGDRLTPTASHTYFQNCTQCHVPASGQHELPRPDDLTGLLLSSGNSFQGLAAGATNAPQYPGAPPTLPHPVWMRQNCLACHGEGRPNAFSVSHPQRQNCLQCHAQNHFLDNRERLTNLYPAFTPINLPAPSTTAPDRDEKAEHTPSKTP